MREILDNENSSQIKQKNWRGTFYFISVIKKQLHRKYA